MKLTAELNGATHQINFQHEDARVTAEVDGRRYEVSALEVDEGSYLLSASGRVYACRVEKNQSEALEVSVGNHTYPVVIVDPKRLRGGHASGAHVSDGSEQIIAPMPGKIVRMLVEVGAQVEAGAGIVVVEAMKMQNELKSPRAGMVSEIRAAAGATVNAGDVLAIIEGTKDEG